MPSTTYTNSTFSIRNIGNREDSGGISISDASAEEDRFIHQILNPGYITPTDAYEVLWTTGRNFTIGSGSAKSDYIVVGGTSQGQGKYIVRLDVNTVTLAVPNGSASTRTDEVYVVVRDTAYDGSATALPQIAYRQGDSGAGAPGPDSSWRAYYKIASISVPSGSGTINQSNFTNTRSSATVLNNVIGAPELVIAGAHNHDIAGVDATPGYAIVTEWDIVPPSGWNTYKVSVISTASFRSAGTTQIVYLRNRIDAGGSAVDKASEDGAQDSYRVLRVANEKSGQSGTCNVELHIQAGNSAQYLGSASLWIATRQT